MSSLLIQAQILGTTPEGYEYSMQIPTFSISSHGIEEGDLETIGKRVKMILRPRAGEGISFQSYRTPASSGSALRDMLDEALNEEDIALADLDEQDESSIRRWRDARERRAELVRAARRV